MLSEEDKKLLFEMHNKADSLRGFIINELISIELYIEWYIAKHFFPSNGELMNEFISTFMHSQQIAIGFSKKVELFAKILERDNKDTFDNNPNLIKDLKDINQHRNYFAHRPLDITEYGTNEFKNATLVFTQYFNGKLNTVKYGNEKIIELHGKILSIKKIVFPLVEAWLNTLK